MQGAVCSGGATTERRAHSVRAAVPHQCPPRQLLWRLLQPQLLLALGRHQAIGHA